MRKNIICAGKENLGEIQDFFWSTCQAGGARAGVLTKERTAHAQKRTSSAPFPAQFPEKPCSNSTLTFRLKFF